MKTNSSAGSYVLIIISITSAENASSHVGWNGKQNALWRPADRWQKQFFHSLRCVARIVHSVQFRHHSCVNGNHDIWWAYALQIKGGQELRNKEACAATQTIEWRSSKQCLRKRWQHTSGGESELKCKELGPKYITTTYSRSVCRGESTLITSLQRWLHQSCWAWQVSCNGSRVVMLFRHGFVCARRCLP